MKFHAVIFDLDGVLCHTDEFHYLAWKSVAEELGLPFDREKNNLLRGVGRMESLDILLGNCEKTAEEKRELAERKNARYVESLMAMSPRDASEEVKGTLAALRAAGIQLAVGSSSKNAGFILERLGMTDCFDAVCDGRHIRKSKPDPEVFLKAAQMLGVQPGETAVVEDALSGVDAAKSGGFFAFGMGDAAVYERTDCPLIRFGDLVRFLTDVV